MTPQNLILLCLLAPLVGALVSVTFQTRLKASIAAAMLFSAVGLVASIALVAATSDGSVHAIHVGNWAAPFGLVLVADTFSALMLAVCQTVILASLIFCAFTLPRRYGRRHLFPLVQTLSFGIAGAFLTGDLFNLYVWFEVLLLSSFAIMAIMPAKKARGGTWRYVVINLVSSLLFLIGAGLIYGKTGSLNFADLHLRFANEPDSFLIASSAALLFGAFAIKSALLPMAFWLPVSYPLLPTALSGLFAGLLTKVGLYAFFRVFGMVFSNGETFPHQSVLLVVALVTMAGGVLGAVAQNDMRRILSFHIISQVGYMALALAIYTPLALAAGIFYLVHHIIVKANLFLVTGLVESHTGSSDLAKTSGVCGSAPIIAVLFAIPALSLAGLPPLSGFFAKFSLLQSAVLHQDWLSAAVVAGVGLLTIFSMLKIWRHIFWGPGEESAQGAARKPSNGILIATSASLGLITIAIGVACGPLLDLAQTAADGLISPAPYLEAVLGAPNPTEP